MLSKEPWWLCLHMKVVVHEPVYIMSRQYSHSNKCDRISLGWLYFMLFQNWMWDECYKKFMYLCHCFHLQKKIQQFARRSIDSEFSRHGSYCKRHCSGLHYYERWLQIPRTYLDHSPRRLKFRCGFGVNSCQYFGIMCIGENCTCFFLISDIY